VRVVIAPDKFRGSVSAPAVARAMAAGVRRVFPRAHISEMPLADGGEGTVDALVGAAGGEKVIRSVTGPLGGPVEAAFGLLPDGRAVVEVAAACGIALVAEEQRDPLRATSFGAGELIGAALDLGATAVIVGIGGTASSDGGTGAAGALGWRFLDDRGADLPPGGGALGDLVRIDGSPSRSIGVPVVGAYDVTNPLTGDRGAARVFAPTKGASPAEVDRLAAGLERLGERIEDELGVRVSDRPGAGSGGGLGAGIMAFFGGTLEPALEIVMDAVGLDDALTNADLVITGEGRIDEQSLAGKTPVGVARRARRAGTRCVVVAGDVGLDDATLTAAGIERAESLVATVGSAVAFAEPESSIEAATVALMSGYG
jgi:glycerate 2-kinase